MNANCTICSDLFDQVNPIASTPCGHVYHANCLTIWLSRSKTCPQCRSRTSIRNIHRLYFDFHPESEVNSSDFENENVQLAARLSAKNEELAKCKQERDKLLIDSEKNACSQLQAVSRLQYENLQLAKSHSVLETRVSELEQINRTLANDLEHLSSVRAIVNGTQRNTEDILEEYNDHSNTARLLATYCCACLKRELLDAVQIRTKLMALNTKLECENKLCVTETNFYADALGISQKIKEVPTTSATSLDSTFNLFSDTPSTSRQNAVSGETPLSVKYRSPLNKCIYKYPTLKSSVDIRTKKLVLQRKAKRENRF